VLEARTREYVEKRVRAGVLEQGTVDVLTELGVADRLHREGMVHHGLELRFGGRGHRIALSELAGGRAITVYGQQEVVKDLIAAGPDVRFEAEAVEIDPDRAAIRLADGSELRCAAVAGCDGFHGVLSPGAGALDVYERVYPFAWLGILAHAAPSSEELIYTHSDRGFALHSMRSSSVTRLYLPGPAGRGRRRVAPTSASGRSSRRGWRPPTGRSRSTRARSSRRASRRCARSWPSRCAAAACSSLATPRTSSPRPARKGSTWRSPTCGCWLGRWPRSSRTGTSEGSTGTRTTACGACGASSTSPGG